MDKRADLRKHFANEANQAKSDAMHSERSAQLSSIEGTVIKGFNSILNQGAGVGKVEITNDKPIKVEMEETGTDKLADAIAGLAQLKGKDGQDGYTPKKGVDYYTEKEIKDITDEIFSKVRIPNDGIDGIDGVDGKTPVKGIDYYTDDEIKSIISYILGVIPTPKDGIDGKDGRTPAIDYKKIITEVIKKIPKPKDGKDGKNYGGGGYYGITELIAGAGISIDATDQYRPIITSTGGGSGGDVVGPSSSVDSNLAAFDTTTGKLLKDSGVATAAIELLSNKVTSLSGASTDVQYPSAKLLYDQLALKLNLSGGTLSGALQLNSTLTTYNLNTFARNGLAATSTDGVYIVNQSAATVGIPVQISPRIRLTGNVWDTGSSSSKVVSFKNEVLPISGNPGSGKLIWGYDYNGGGYTELMGLSSNGLLTTPSIQSSGFINLGAGRREFGNITNGKSLSIGYYTAGDYGLIETGDWGTDYRNLIINPLGGNVGIRTPSRTAEFSLTFGSSATGIAIYNTADQTTNYERGLISWNTNILTLETQKGGTGTSRSIRLSAEGGGTTFTLGRATTPFALLTHSNSSAAGNIFQFSGTSALSSGIYSNIAITPTISQSSTAGYTALLINPTHTSTGSGAKLLTDWQVGGTSLAKMQSDGVFLPLQKTTAAAPTYVKGGIYFDTTLNKLRVGGATAWETITSV